MFLGTPNFSIISIACGSAASELAVENARSAGSLSALISALKGILIILHTTAKTVKTNNVRDKYTMPINDADTFMRSYLGIPATIIDVTKIDFSKDVFNFTKDDNNYYVEVANTGLDPIQNCVLNEVNIVSDSEIEVTYGVMELGKTCEDKSDECYTKMRKLIMRKADDGFTILTVTDVKEDSNNQATE